MIPNDTEQTTSGHSGQSGKLFQELRFSLALDKLESGSIGRRQVHDYVTQGHLLGALIRTQSFGSVLVLHQ